MKFQAKLKKGFTLVELAIVLVIVGLLTSGVLIAQSLIDSAKMSAFIRQMQQIETAKDLFLDKYKVLPGDGDLFRAAVKRTGGPMVPRTGDGILCDDDCAQNTWWSDSEQGNFFLDLNKISKLKFDNCRDFHEGNLMRMVAKGEQCNVPLSKLGENAMIFVGSASLRPNEIYYFIGDCKDMSGQGWYNSANDGDECYTPFTGAEALSYDLKTDDGLPRTGNVFSSVNGFGQHGGWALGTAIGERDGDQEVAGAQNSYNATSSDRTHQIMQKMQIR